MRGVNREEIYCFCGSRILFIRRATSKYGDFFDMQSCKLFPNNMRSEETDQPKSIGNTAILTESPPRISEFTLNRYIPNSSAPYDTTIVNNWTKNTSSRLQVSWLWLKWTSNRKTRNNWVTNIHLQKDCEISPIAKSDFILMSWLSSTISHSIWRLSDVWTVLAPSQTRPQPVPHPASGKWRAAQSLISKNCGANR